MEDLIREYENVPEYRHLLARCYVDIPADRGRPSPANIDRATDLLRKLVAEYPKVPDYRFDLCESLGRPQDADDADRSRARLKEAIDLSAPLVADYPHVPDYAAARARYLNEYGVLTFLAGKPEEAQTLMCSAVAEQGKIVAEHPAVVAYRFWLSAMERCLGRVLCERKQWPEARLRLESAIARLEAPAVGRSATWRRPPAAADGLRRLGPHADGSGRIGARGLRGPQGPRVRRRSRP